MAGTSVMEQKLFDLAHDFLQVKNLGCKYIDAYKEQIDAYKNVGTDDDEKNKDNFEQAKEHAEALMKLYMELRQAIIDGSKNEAHLRKKFNDIKKTILGDAQVKPIDARELGGVTAIMGKDSDLANSVVKTQAMAQAHVLHDYYLGCYAGLSDQQKVSMAALLIGQFCQPTGLLSKTGDFSADAKRFNISRQEVLDKFFTNKNDMLIEVLRLVPMEFLRKHFESEIEAAEKQLSVGSKGARTAPMQRTDAYLEKLVEIFAKKNISIDGVISKLSPPEFNKLVNTLLEDRSADLNERLKGVLSGTREPSAEDVAAANKAFTLVMSCAYDLSSLPRQFAASKPLQYQDNAESIHGEICKNMLDVLKRIPTDTTNLAEKMATSDVHAYAKLGMALAHIARKDGQLSKEENELIAGLNRFKTILAKDPQMKELTEAAARKSDVQVSKGVEVRDKPALSRAESFKKFGRSISRAFLPKSLKRDESVAKPDESTVADDRSSTPSGPGRKSGL